MGTNLSAVIIYHQPDFEYLRLQAISFRTYAAKNLFQKILVVENFTSNSTRKLRSALHAAYGDLSAIVEYVRADEICDMPEIEGWLSQQILKLAVSKKIDTDKYVVFDAKNHLIAPLTFDALASANGQAFMDYDGYEDHPLLKYFESTLRYFDLNPGAHIHSFPQTITPFVFFTEHVQSLICYIEGREHKSLQNIFLQKDFTEFFLYSSYLYDRGEIDTLYIRKKNSNKVIWPHMNDDISVRKLLEEADQQSLMFSVHRNALKGMSRKSINRIAQFWAKKGLFSDEKAAVKFLRSRYRDLMGAALKELLRRVVTKIQKKCRPYAFPQMTMKHLSNIRHGQ